MLGTGIKNAILLFLIILILHFLIKNTLLEKRAEQKDDARVQKSDEVSLPKASAAPAAPAVAATAADKKKELFDFVMMEDDASLPIAKEGFVEPNDKFQNELPVACGAQKIMNDEHPIIAKSKKAKDKTSHGDYLVIHEYEDESSLNGGKLLGGLSGFDSYDTMYQEYKCGA